MRACWAACLRDCSPGLTKEHSVSKSLFQTDEIFVQGFEWCLREPKKVGLANVAKKHLCRRHNERLSETDEAAASVLRAFEQVARAADVRISAAGIEIKGCDFERWALKTLINVCADDVYPIGKNSNRPGAPSPRLVQIAFGLKYFPWRAGIYFVGEPKGQFEYTSRYTFSPLVSAGNYLEGTLLIFCGFRFVLLFGDPGQSIHELNVLGGNRAFGPGPLTVAHHPRALETEVGERHMKMSFRW